MCCQTEFVVDRSYISLALYALGHEYKIFTTTEGKRTVLC